MLHGMWDISSPTKDGTQVPCIGSQREGRSCPTLCDPMDYTVHGILQARILEWVPFPFSRGSSQPGIKPKSPTLRADSLPAESQGKPKHPWNICLPIVFSDLSSKTCWVYRMPTSLIFHL